MRIWIELANSPHINMFTAMIRELKQEHEVVITCRPLGNTVDLLDLHGIKYTVVGVHYGGRLSAKVLGFPVRVMHLRNFLSSRDIDVGISQSSFPAPVAARSLGVRSIYLNDNEHAMGNIPAFMCADKIMVPEFIATAKLKRQWADMKKADKVPEGEKWSAFWSQCSKDFAAKNGGATATEEKPSA